MACCCIILFLTKAPCHPYQKKQKPKKKTTDLLKWSIFWGKRSAEGAAAEVSLSLQIFCISKTTNVKNDCSSAMFLTSSKKASI